MEENNTNNNKPRTCNSWCGCCGSNGYGWGIVLLVIGLFFLARDFGWFDINISFWTVVLIVFGLYFIFARKKRQ